MTRGREPSGNAGLGLLFARPAAGTIGCRSMLPATTKRTHGTTGTSACSPRPNKRMQLTGRGGLGVARFARQSSLMRAPQLIRGVGRTLDTCAVAEEDGDSTTRAAASEGKGRLSCP